MVTLGLLAGWLLAGLLVAALLARRSAPAGAVLGALVAWPLLVPLLGERAARGTHGERIDRALDELLATLADPAAGDVGFSGDLTGLRAALHRLDARLALVDKLLAEQPDTPSAAALHDARAAALADIERVLAEVAELRVQVGLVALAGDGAALRSRLRELSARAAALGEVHVHGRDGDVAVRPPPPADGRG